MKVKFRMLFLFTLLIMLPCSACSEQSFPPDAGIGPNIQYAGGPVSERQDVRQFEPPPEAYKACEGKIAGSPAQLASPRGETITGTCEEKDGKLFLRPDRLKGGPGDRHHGPPPEAYEACEGKIVGSPGQFTDRRGNIVKGICEKEGERLLLRPDWLKANTGREQRR